MTNPTRGAEQVAIEVLDTCVKGTSPGGQELNVCVDLPKATALISAAIDEALGEACHLIRNLIADSVRGNDDYQIKWRVKARHFLAVHTPKEEK